MALVLQTTHACRHCGVELTLNNWPLSHQKYGDYLCIFCNRQEAKETGVIYRRKLGMKTRRFFDGTCHKCGVELDESNSIKHSTSYRRCVCKSCLANARKKHYYLNLATIKTKMRKYRERWVSMIKHDVVSHYSQYQNKCALCGFEDIRALSIDHINGGGNEERERLKLYGGSNFYKWLKANNYPSGYRILCMNCQFITTHERKRLGS